MKSKIARERRQASDARDLEVDVQVFLERLVGAELEDREVVLDHARCEPCRWRSQRRGEVTLGVDIDGEDALAGAGADERERGGHGAAAGASLARDEDDPPREQRGELDPFPGDRAPNRR